MTHFGYRIHKDQSIGKLHLLHREYMEKVREHFDIQKCKLVSASFIFYFRLFSVLLLKIEKEKEYMSSVSYISVVGSIISVIKFICECFYILHFNS